MLKYVPHIEQMCSPVWHDLTRMVRDVTNWYLGMKECSGVAWPGLLKAGNVTKTVSELSKVSEEWRAPAGVRSGMLHNLLWIIVRRKGWI
jgi:hypothetical protein